MPREREKSKASASESRSSSEPPPRRSGGVETQSKTLPSRNMVAEQRDSRQKGKDQRGSGPEPTRAELVKSKDSSKESKGEKAKRSEPYVDPRRRTRGATSSGGTAVDVSGGVQTQNTADADTASAAMLTSMKEMRKKKAEDQIMSIYEQQAAALEAFAKTLNAEDQGDLMKWIEAKNFGQGGPPSKAVTNRATPSDQ